MIGQEITPPGLWSWLRDHSTLVLSKLGQHVELVVIAVGVGLVISLPLAILAYRHGRVYPPITWSAGLLYAIPSIALFVILIPVTGLTVLTVEIGLVGYTLLILIRNIVVGLRGVPEDVREAAIGMGHTRRQLLWRIEIPLALPAIVAGVRVATVSTVGLVTVGFIIGKGGLGQLIIQGLESNPTGGGYLPEIEVGVVLAVALALVADALLLFLQRVLTPWTRRGAGAGAGAPSVGTRGA